MIINKKTKIERTEDWTLDRLLSAEKRGKIGS